MLECGVAKRKRSWTWVWAEIPVAHWERSISAQLPSYSTSTDPNLTLSSSIYISIAKAKSIFPPSLNREKYKQTTFKYSLSCPVQSHRCSNAATILRRSLLGGSPHSLRTADPKPQSLRRVLRATLPPNHRLHPPYLPSPPPRLQSHLLLSLPLFFFFLFLFFKVNARLQGFPQSHPCTITIRHRIFDMDDVWSALFVIMPEFFVYVTAGGIKIRVPWFLFCF